MLRKKSQTRHLALGATTLAASILSLGMTAPTQAAVTSAHSEGYGVQVDLQVAGLISVDALSLIPGQLSQGNATPAYNVSATAIPADINAGIGIGSVAGTAVELDLATLDGVLNSSAESNVDGSMGSKSASGFGQVNNLDLDVVDANVTLLGITTASLDLVNVTAGTISSTANVTGDAGSLAANGDMIIQDLVLEVGGLQLDLANLLGVNGSIDANGFITAAPNTTILDVGGIVGLNLTLNEQILTGDGVNERGIEVNALHLSFSGVDLGLPLITGLLNGDVIIGHSQASMSAVPEPASIALLLMGGAMMAHRRRRQA